MADDASFIILQSTKQLTTLKAKNSQCGIGLFQNMLYVYMSLKQTAIVRLRITISGAYTSALHVHVHVSG